MNSNLNKWLKKYSENNFKLVPVVFMEKRPAIKNFLKEASSDLSKLMKWSQSARHKGGSWGLALAPSGFVAIDIDRKNFGLEEWEKLVNVHGDPQTLKAESGSGGLHYVFKAKPGARYKGKIQDGIDIRHNHIIVIQPSLHPRTKNEYKWLMDIENAVQSYPGWIANLIEKAANNLQEEIVKSSNEELQILVEEIQKHNLDYDEWVQIGMALHSADPGPEGLKLFLQATNNQAYENGDYDKAQEKWSGFSNKSGSPKIGIGTIIHIIREHAGDLSALSLVRDKKRFLSEFSQFDAEKMTGAKIESGSYIFDKKEDLVETVNNHGFFYLAGAANDCFGKSIDDPTLSDADFILFTQKKLKSDLAPLKLRTGDKKARLHSADVVWTENKNRKTFSRIRFSPVHKPGELNMWKPLQIEPIEKNCDYFLEMIFESICSGNEVLNDYLISWFAHLIQNPAEKATTIPVLFSELQGTGKNLICDGLMRQILGKMHLKMNDMNELSGRFNSHLAYRLLTFIDELSWGQSSKTISVLKGLSGSDIMSVEYKHGARVTVENYSRYILATNHEASIPIEKGNRRFVVIEGSPKYANNETFFAPIVTKVKSGETAAAFLSHLQKYDISTFNPNKIPNQKNLGIQAKLKTSGEVAKFWYNLFFNEPGLIFIKEKGLVTHLAYGNYLLFAKATAKENNSDFWNQSKKIIPILQNKALKQHRIQGTEERFRAYQVGPFEALQSFCLGLQIDEPPAFNPMDYLSPLVTSPVDNASEQTPYDF